MLSTPLVSVIIIFLNADEFLQEAIESVLAQTYDRWELILVDDGSTDRSTQMAREYADLRPGKVIYLEHADHANLGKGASRNLGIRRARGEYVAFLDADDVWLPHKLEQQAAIFGAYPDAGMLYGNTLYWYSWTDDEEDLAKDFIPKLGVETEKLIYPPMLLSLYLRGKAAVPCTCSILVRRRIAAELHGFDETFTGVNNIYEDQTFVAKLCCTTPVVVVNSCWDKYRQQPQSSMAVAQYTGTEVQARKFFLHWLEAYLNRKSITDRQVWQELRRAMWLISLPRWMPQHIGFQKSVRWVKKWILRAEEQLFPQLIRNRLWANGKQALGPRRAT
jgi:glycosyltransferase involved in cell wall biosynthesis